TPLLCTDVCEAEEVERLGFPLTASASVRNRKRPELQQPRLLGVQLQVELSESLLEIRPELLGLHLTLEPQHDVVGKPHDDDVAFSLPLSPYLNPEIEHVVQVDIRQERRGAAPLRRPFLYECSLPILQHASVQPFLDEPHDAPIRDAMLDESHQPPVVDGIEEPTDVQVEHPVH